MGLTKITKRKWDFLLVSQSEPGVYLNLLQIDIVFITASRSYCSIQTVDKKYILSQPMGEIEDMLNPDMFLRIGRSYIINPLYLKSAIGYVLTFEYSSKKSIIKVPHAAWNVLLPYLPVIGKRRRVIQKQRERIKKQCLVDDMCDLGG